MQIPGCLQDFVIMMQPMNTIIYFWATSPLIVDAIFECHPWLLDYVQKKKSAIMKSGSDAKYLLKSFIQAKRAKRARLGYKKSAFSHMHYVCEGVEFLWSVCL